MHPIPVLAVAAAMLFLAGMAARAYLRSQNLRLLFVCAAFFVFAVKGLVTAYALWRGWPGHEDLEVLGSVLDLAVAGLFIAPFLIRR